MPTKIERARNRYALDCRLHGTDSPQAQQSKAALATEKLAAYVDSVVAESPELSDDQVAVVIRALTPAALIASAGGVPTAPITSGD